MTDTRIDLYPCCQKPPVIWGKVYDECGMPISGSLVQLVYCREDEMQSSFVVNQTYSDCNGCYEMQMPCYNHGKYRIEVGLNKPVRDKGCMRQNSICYY